ncbi:transcriptional regulator [Streptomyces caeruleatus]|uniref:Uncharacterized protein n=1 Tax=Streptomyces caeruleatus TaxID=661399 RepID=A0A124I9K7_9ACTN|nr:transcriptional regulator [Streptomyces caeruleatus]KUO02885.1 hypothetical protein AQJ67_20970 [Streptomyces caeruleatus]
MRREDGREHEVFEDADGFKPLSEKLRPEVRELATALPHLLKGSGKSQRQFAVYYRTSVSSVSRYFSGERIPEKHFLDGLMKSACKAHGTEVPADLQGRGELESAFDHYAPAPRGTCPERRRTDLNPLNRKEYLLNLTRRVGG